jgi:hypothetical protein
MDTAKMHGDAVHPSFQPAEPASHVLTLLEDKD